VNYHRHRKTDVNAFHGKRMFKAGPRGAVAVSWWTASNWPNSHRSVAGSVPEYSSYWLKPGMARQEKQITVSSSRP